MAKYKRCVACKKPFEPKKPTDELCPTHAKQFEQIYGSEGDDMGKKASKGAAVTPVVAIEERESAEERTLELFEGVDDDGAEPELDEDDTPGTELDESDGGKGAEESGVSEAPAATKKEPGWTRRPKAAAKRLRLCLKFLGRFDWARLDADGVQGALAVLAHAASKLEARQANAAPRRVAPDAAVRVRDSARKLYADLFGPEELDNLTVVAIAGKKVRVANADRSQLVFPLAHLELVS